MEKISIWLTAVNSEDKLTKAASFPPTEHPDFPATEPDDRVNEMAGRAVHIAEVNPEKSEPLGSDAEGIKNCGP